MNRIKTPSGGYFLAAALEAAAGGIAVVVLTRAVPEMMSRMMASMMKNMMEQMGAEGCNPEEM